MNTLLDELPQQTLLQVREATDLLAAVKIDDLTEPGEMGMFRLLRDMSKALKHLEDNHSFKREVKQ